MSDHKPFRHKVQWVGHTVTKKEAHRYGMVRSGLHDNLANYRFHRPERRNHGSVDGEFFILRGMCAAGLSDRVVKEPIQE